MNLFKIELLLILDKLSIIVSENNDSMKKLIIMKKEDNKYRHFTHI